MLSTHFFSYIFSLYMYTYAHHAHIFQVLPQVHWSMSYNGVYIGSCPHKKIYIDYKFSPKGSRTINGDWETSLIIQPLTAVGKILLKSFVSIFNAALWLGCMLFFLFFASISTFWRSYMFTALWRYPWTSWLYIPETLFQFSLWSWCLGDFNAAWFPPFPLIHLLVIT